MSASRNIAGARDEGKLQYRESMRAGESATARAAVADSLREERTPTLVRLRARRAVRENES